MSLIGSLGHSYSIEASPDLFAWTVFTNVTGSNAVVTISDTTANFHNVSIAWSSREKARRSGAKITASSSCSG